MTGSSESTQKPATWYQIPEEELRLAVVMNGGVSLAVWMGGVAHEINRLTWSAGSFDEPGRDYGPILRLVRCTAGVDVISGTSAGGINGAALALGQLNANADLTTMRSLWNEQGRMEALLRQPFRGQPSSLLRGDEYFLPELHRAMASLVGRYQQVRRPVDLTITTTLLAGRVRTVTDGLGQVLLQREHGSKFHFRTASEGDEPGTGLFAPARIRRTAGALALAARCTASFPFAFEPSFVPVAAGTDSDPDDRADALLRPDMRRFAAWARHREGDVSRYAVDGGLLANTPTRDALEAIDRRPASGPLRRVMLLVFPHAPARLADRPDRPDDPPTVTAALSGVLAALTSQGSLTFVHEIEEHNRRASAWRGGRVDILRSLTDGVAEDASEDRRARRSTDEPAGLPGLYQLVRIAWPHYRGLRRRTSAMMLAEFYTEHGSREGWPFERIRSEAEVAQGDGDQPSPYVPLDPPLSAAALGVTGRDAEGGTGCPLTGWGWGVGVATGIADAAADVLRRALSVATEEEASRLRPARAAVSAARDEITRQREQLDDLWQAGSPLDRCEPGRDYWQARLTAYRRAVIGPDADDETTLRTLLGLPEPEGPAAADDPAERALQSLLGRRGEIGRQIGCQVWEVAAALEKVREVIVGIRGHRSAVAELDHWRWLLAGDRLADGGDRTRPDEPGRPELRLLLRLLALDTATWLVAENRSTGTMLPIQLAQLSLAIQHPFARRSTAPEDKAAGMALNRFGGFLKRSWRMNDWAWGRLDAVTMLCKIALDPRRLARMAAVYGVGPDTHPAEVTALAGGLVDDLERGLYGGRVTDPAHLVVKQEATAELARVLSGHRPLPTELSALVGFAAYPLQMRIMLEELPVLAAAIKADRVEGSNPRSNGERFLLEHAGLVAAAAAPSTGRAADPDGWRELGARALAAFDEAGIGREDLLEEAGSDAMIRTAANAAGVIATVVDSDRFGIRAVKPVTRAVRGAALLPYWLVTGLTRPPGLARALAQFGFLVGGVLLALGLLGVLGAVSSAAAGIGLATLLAAFGYSALRTGSVAHGVALLGPVVPLLAFVLAERRSDDDVARAAGTVVAILGVALGLAVIATIPWPLSSPQHSYGKVLRRRRAARLRLPEPVALTPRTVAVESLRLLWPVLALVGLVVAGALVLRAGWWVELSARFGAWLDGQVTALGNGWLVAGFGALCAGVGALVAYVVGKGLRTYHRGPDGTWRQSPVSHPAGVASGWSVVYGAAYLLLAAALAGWLAAQSSAPAWMVVSFGWCVLLGLVLTLLAPWLIPRRFQRSLSRSLAGSPLGGASLAGGSSAGSSAGGSSAGGNDGTELLLARLERGDQLFGYLCRPDPAQPAQLVLRRKGNRLRRLVVAEPPGSRLAHDRPDGSPARP